MRTLILTPGTRLGVYEIVSPIGSGGMGEVFRARDTTLYREVALNLLSDALAGDWERLARFKREAQVLSSLNHPNIAHVYGFESATLDDGTKGHFLAMELVAGEDLAERLQRGCRPAGREPGTGRTSLAHSPAIAESATRATGPA